MAPMVIVHTCVKMVAGGSSRRCGEFDFHAGARRVISIVRFRAVVVLAVAGKHNVDFAGL